ncbi:hypothetical protein [Chitinophaga sp. Ak27]|uniref:hypothetical protein n=1 Tax=Chitinophaga sp. Ak27 TaxID=2726116 RepID=UPI00145CFB20|nr:hypothetical protein [Chitinophaga sp. Ak27]NLU92649.1 hypothetical protein [Chitinophaga sp. Ak27]
MQKSNVDILNHLYGLLLDMNFHEPDEDIWEGNSYKQDPFIAKHLRQIKLRTAKLRAVQQKSVYSNLVAEVQRLKEFGFDKLKQMLSQREAQQLYPLFNRFEQLTEKDKDSIAEDQELLHLFSILKDKLNNFQSDEPSQS